MIGHALIDSGRLDEGERSCRDALAVFPGDYRALTGLAEAATWRQDWQAAADWARKAVAACPQNPEAIRLLGEALEEQGDTEGARTEFRRLERLAASFPRIYDRHWILFCADRERDLDAALALARKDLELRQDVLAHDTLAWVCYKKGLLDEAEGEMAKALSRGLQTAQIYHHAGAIAKASGELMRAEAYFSVAKRLNPYLAKSVRP
jgi:tetratricopeptide (TPR) repeat protein